MTTYPQIVNAGGQWNWTGSRDLFGATVNPPKGTAGYPDAFPVSVANAQAFDAVLGVGPVAAACQKVYISNLPTKVDPNWVAYTQAGGRLIVCCEPPITMTPTDATNYTAFIEALSTTLPAGSFEVVNWQEPQTAKHFNGNATLFHEVAAFYGAAVRAAAPGVPLVYDPALAGDKDLASPQSCIDFFPGSAYCDKWPLDWYLTSELREADALADLQAIAAVADPLGIPLGLGEFNASASSQPTTRDQWETFVDLIITFFYGRLQAGLNNAEICFWMGEQSGAPDLLGEQIVGLRRVHQWLAP